MSGSVRLPSVARVTGLEPATSGVTGRRSNQLSYTRIKGPSTKPCLAFRQAGPLASQTTGDLGGDGIEPPTLSV